METASRGLQILHLDSLGIMACRGVGLDQPGGDFTYMEVASTEGLVACQEKGAITCVSQGACFETTRWRCVGRVAIAQLVVRRSHNPKVVSSILTCHMFGFRPGKTLTLDSLTKFAVGQGYVFSRVHVGFVKYSHGPAATLALQSENYNLLQFSTGHGRQQFIYLLIITRPIGVSS